MDSAQEQIAIANESGGAPAPLQPQAAIAANSVQPGGALPPPQQQGGAMAPPQIPGGAIAPQVPPGGAIPSPARDHAQILQQNRRSRRKVRAFILGGSDTAVDFENASVASEPVPDTIRFPEPLSHRLLTTNISPSQSRQDWEEQAIALYMQDVTQAKAVLVADEANTESTTPATYRVLARQIYTLIEALRTVHLIFKGIIRFQRLPRYRAAMKDVFEVIHSLSHVQSIEARETLLARGANLLTEGGHQDICHVVNQVGQMIHTEKDLKSFEVLAPNLNLALLNIPVLPPLPPFILQGYFPPSSTC